jgi:two-component system, NtrC family, nitrogen regulation sensor histidine kinase GlnL
MTSAAGHRRPLPSDGEAILNALPNPVLLIAPDGKIVDANMAAESFFEISTQFLQRQSLKELVPFGSPLLALIDQVRSSGSPVNEYKVDLGTPGPLSLTQNSSGNDTRDFLPGIDRRTPGRNAVVS